ncbi:MAG: hypothetical protein HUK03_08535 [Bacteroidaceae bacterium]|nr:hypothetical protein [Bacteroidaceae bacterium]
MLSFILTATIGVALASAVPSSVSEPKDTTDVYIINKQNVEHFDGSQLAGKSVKSYHILRSAEKPIRIHDIVTNEPSDAKGQNSSTHVKEVAKFSSRAAIQPDHALIILDGKPIKIGEFIQLTRANAVKNVTSITNPELIKHYTTDKKITCVLEVTTK